MAKGNAKEAQSGKIVVTGDMAVDCFEVPAPPAESKAQGAKSLHNWQVYPGIQRMTKPGGALHLAEFVRAATGAEVLAPEFQIAENVVHSGTAAYPEIVHSFVSLDKFASSASQKVEKDFVYRVKDYKGFAGPAAGVASSLPLKQDDAGAEIVVLDDAGNGFRDMEAHWPAALNKGSEPIVLMKMSRPLAEGALFEKLRKHHADRMIVVVTADDLRQAGAKICRRLSWENTAMDFVWQMACNPALLPLNNCACLIVRFGLEGAVVHRRRAGLVESRLFYDPKIAEDGFGDFFPGKMLGLGSAFVAALAAGLCRKGLDGLDEAVREGMLASRRLWQQGFGSDPANLAYPVPQIFKPADAREAVIAGVVIPNPDPAASAGHGHWSILEEVTRCGLEQVASNYVISGSDPALDRIPVGEFRNLKTFDRSEVESFRSIRNLIQEYLAASDSNRPLNIAVFGSPGSGKSFGVTEVAQSVAPGKLDSLEFNLSQFNSTDELITAFHKTRDISLGGKIPIVFFDEFDSEFRGELGWLKYFLAPMNDGIFRDGEATHPIGRAIFVFAGGTSCTFAEFCAEEESEAAAGKAGEAEEGRAERKPDRQERHEKFKKAKGPDFVSRLRGYVNIKGPNPLNENDRLSMIRRAISLRFILEKKAKHIFDGRKRCRIDPGVLRALLKVPEYKHGIRSMMAIIEMSMLAGRRSFEQAALPSPEQLRLHADADTFHRLVVRDVLLGSVREEMAKAIHEKYREDNKDKRSADDPAMASWEKLLEDLRESNRRQADHIPVKLKAVGCDFAQVCGRAPKLVEFTKDEIERMAEMEHARFVAERFMQGWSQGPRNQEKKTSPYLVEWKELDEATKEYDRQAVRAMPEILAKAGFEIYRVK
jgi:hypothetical protein